jgi:hypothetical protein
MRIGLFILRSLDVSAPEVVIATVELHGAQWVMRLFLVALAR